MEIIKMSKHTYLVKIFNLAGTKIYEKECESIMECKEYMRTINGECKAIIQKNLDYQGMNNFAEETLHYKINNNKVVKINL